MTTYKTLNPHAKTIANWTANNFLPDHPQIPQTEMTFLAAVGQGTKYYLTDPAPEDPARPRKEVMISETKELAERPIKRTIHNFYRLKDKDGVEYFYFLEKLSGETFQGPPANHSRIVGRYPISEYSKIRDRQTGEVRMTGITGNVKKYDIPFAETFTDPSTGETNTLTNLAKLVVEDRPWFYVWIGAQKWEVKNITYAEYMAASLADLTVYAKTLTWPEKKPAELTVKSKKVTVKDG